MLRLHQTCSSAAQLTEKALLQELTEGFKQEGRKEDIIGAIKSLISSDTAGHRRKEIKSLLITIVKWLPCFNSGALLMSYQQIEI